MESLKNLISLFDSEKFFFMTAFLPVMVYKDFSETQRISIFYIMFWFSAIYQKYMSKEKVSVVYILSLLVIVTFLSLEILTFDVPKLSLITNIVYKIIDYIFIMLSQYGVIYMLFSVIILETRNEIIMIFSIFLILNGLIKVFNLKLKDVISYIFPFDCLKKIFGLFGSKLNNYTFLKYYLWDLFICYAVVFLYSSLIYYYCIIKEKNVLVSISLLFIGILIISSGDFKIRKIMELFKYLPSPVKTNENIFPSECIYDISFFEWMDKFDKEKNYEYYQILYEFLDKKKSKLFKWLKINHMEMSLVRSLGIWYGRENLIRLYFFSVIYTVFYTRSLRKFFEKRYGHFYSDIYFFRNYLLKICMKHFTLNFSQKVKYSSICNYMGERKENWSKEKFFVGCIGFEINEIERRLDQIEERLKNEVFTAEIFNESKYSQIVKKYNLSRSKIKKEILVIEIINDSKYSKIIKKYNLSESEIGRHLRKIVSNE